MKPGKGAVSTANFLFVDYQKDDPRDAAMHKEKLLFTQRNYQRKKKLAAVERLKASSKISRQRLPFKYIPTDTPNESETDRDSSTPRADTDQSRQAWQMARMAELWSPKTYLGQGFVDPFSTVAVPMTETMNSYFHHLRNHTIQGSYPLDSPRMKIWWWQQAISQPAIQQALLWSAASHQIALNTLNNVSPQSEEHSTWELLRLRGDTIKTLNTVLQDPHAVAESTILIVASLRAIEAISASFEGVAAHNKGLETLINLAGGLDFLDHLTLSKIYHGDIMSAALHNSRPILPLIPRWRSEILQETKVFESNDFLSQLNDRPGVVAELSSLGKSFLQSPWFLKLDPSMTTFLRVFQRLIQYYEAAKVKPSMTMPTDNDLFVVFEHQLVSITYTAANNLEEALRLCLLIYLNMRVWHFQNFPIMQHMVEALRQNLMAGTIITHFKDTDPTLLFWVLFIGGMASLRHNGHLWFVAHLTKITNYLGISDWASAREILGGFFYTDQPDEKGGEDLWSEVLVKGHYSYIAPFPSFEVSIL
ncbi:hypothetical protein BJX99DRAFT_204985 [Aspergillus californicus]